MYYIGLKIKHTANLCAYERIKEIPMPHLFAIFLKPCSNIDLKPASLHNDVYYRKKKIDLSFDNFA